MGFDDKWLKLVELIFTLRKLAALLNGMSGRQFLCNRGVRQADPLSPLIFVLAPDHLSRLSTKHSGIALYKFLFFSWFWYGLSCGAICDTLILMPACDQQVRTMKEIFHKYANSTGLHINFDKSSIIPINLSHDETITITDILWCDVAYMPFSYLGLPLGTTKQIVHDLMPLVDTIERTIYATS
jgi:hypothetical protein